MAKIQRNEKKKKCAAERYKFIDKQLKVTQSAKITRNCFFFPLIPCFKEFHRNHSVAIFTNPFSWELNSNLNLEPISFKVYTKWWVKPQRWLGMRWKKWISSMRFLALGIVIGQCEEKKKHSLNFLTKSRVRQLWKEKSNRNGRFIGHFIIMNVPCS